MQFLLFVLCLGAESVYALRLDSHRLTSESSCAFSEYSNGPSRVPFDATMFNAGVVHTPPGYFETGTPTFNPDGYGIFVSPQDKFAFCSIAKVGSSDWQRLTQNMLQNATGHGNTPTDNMAVLSFKKYGPEGLNAVFSDPNAQRVVFLRDPLSRFVSAFLDKCVAKPQEGRCYAAPSGLVDGKRVTMRHAVEWALATDFSAIEDGHWRLQADHCGLRENLKSFTHIGYAGKDEYDQDVKCLLTHARLSRFNVWNDAPIFGALPINQKPKLATDDQETEWMKKLLTRDAAEKLFERSSIRQDYDLFGFPKPAWIEQATGELYDTDEHDVVSLHKMHKAMIASHDA